MNKIEPIAFFIDAEEKFFDDIENTIKQYNISRYIIAHEKTNADLQDKPHYHFICDMSLKTYNNLIKKFKLQFCLSGKGHGGTRHYGKINHIKDIEKLKSYTLKDNNFRFSGYTKDEIDALFAKSTPKITEKGKIQLMYKEIDEYKKYTFPSQQLNFIMRKIINYKLDHEQQFTATQLKNQTYKYFQWSQLYSRNEKFCILEYQNIFY